MAASLAFEDVATILDAATAEKTPLGVPLTPPVSWEMGEYVLIRETSLPDYEGPYSVVPTSHAQVLETRGKVMSGDVTIEPIPSNYGLIEWDGAVLRVS